ncbi:hypothetical protein BH09ACT10_BH09ACT10_29430 [soil metagenome]
MADERYAERVLRLVEQIPRGEVLTYGVIADLIGSGPRQVGAVMAHVGGGVPWWRVVRADGSLPDALRGRAAQHYRDEATPMTHDGIRVAVRSALWHVPPDLAVPEAPD